MKEEIRKTIESAVKENESHKIKIERVRKLLNELFPTDVESF